MWSSLPSHLWTQNPTDHHNTEITEEKYIENILGKTSAMFSIACGSGSYEGKCKDSEVLLLNLLIGHKPFLHSW